jgi:Flp pilus assembly pilin Flp
MKRFFRGQGLVEYAILIALIAVGIALALKLYGVSVHDAYCAVADKISNGQSCKPVQLCQDDFSSDLAGWTAMQGTKGSAGNGKYCPPSYDLALNTCSTAANSKDYSVSLTDANLSSGSGYGLMFRAQNTPNGLTGYVFQYDPGYSPGSFIFRKWVNGAELSTPIAVAKMPGYDWYNTPRDIKVVVKGDTFTAYVDGQPVLTAQDSSYTSGGSGIRTWDSTQVCFDQFGMQSTP